MGTSDGFLGTCSQFLDLDFVERPIGLSALDSTKEVPSRPTKKRKAKKIPTTSFANTIDLTTTHRYTLCQEM